MLCKCSTRWSPASREPLKWTCMHGFELVETFAIPELHITTYSLRHIKTNAPYYHIDSEDSNNSFCIGFRTPARNNKGTSHVLEHTTLCGSAKFPVRRPFFMMLKRSLSTYMNAITRNDHTLYPFSTTNRVDFHNLLDVYLDAVFNPLLREEDFWQEGHRIEIDNKDEDIAEELTASKHKNNYNSAAEEKQESEEKSLIEEQPSLLSSPSSSLSSSIEQSKILSGRLRYNGVVFNEMRAVMTDPSQYFTRELLANMLPRTHYIFESGGIPTEIVRLTYDELKEFHATHYHPSNSVAISYGCIHPSEHMELLNEYYSQFELSKPVVIPHLPHECRFRHPRTVMMHGPVEALGNAERQKRVAVSVALPESESSLIDVVSYSILNSLLTRGPSSPIFKSLIESHIGTEFVPMQGYDYTLSTPLFTYGVCGVDENRPNVEKEVLYGLSNALKEVTISGFDERRLRSVVFQEELRQRHRAAEYGLHEIIHLCTLALCKPQYNTMEFINWLPHLKTIVKDNGQTLLSRVTNGLLHNSHRIILSISAKESHLTHIQQRVHQMEEELNQDTEMISEHSRREIALRNSENKERLRSALLNSSNTTANVLPSLELHDIPTASFAEPEPIRSSLSVHGNVYTIPYHTNGLVYVHGLIPYSSELAHAMTDGPIESLPQNYPYLSLLLGRTGAGPYNFKEHSIATELVCNGFSFWNVLNESYMYPNTTVAGLGYSFYTTRDKLREALSLLRLTLLSARANPNDPQVFSRTLALLKMACSDAIQSLPNEGMRMAISNAVSRLTRRGEVREYWYGLTASRYASQLLEMLQGSAEHRKDIIYKFLSDFRSAKSDIAAAVTRGVHWATCETDAQEEVSMHLRDFLSGFPFAPHTTTIASSQLHLPRKKLFRRRTLHVSELLPIDTAFVAYAIPNQLTWTDPMQAAVRVACLLLSNEYLHERIREEGGAYGCSAIATLYEEVGGITLSSFRDPTPQRTEQVFMSVSEWLSEKSNITEERVKEAKLRLIGLIDTPYAADNFGTAFFYNDVRQSMKQEMRDRLLAVTPTMVQDVSELFSPNGHDVMSLLESLSPERSTKLPSQPDIIDVNKNKRNL